MEVRARGSGAVVFHHLSHELRELLSFEVATVKHHRYYEAVNYRHCLIAIADHDNAACSQCSQVLVVGQVTITLQLFYPGKNCHRVL